MQQYFIQLPSQLFALVQQRHQKKRLFYLGVLIALAVALATVKTVWFIGLLFIGLLAGIPVIRKVALQEVWGIYSMTFIAVYMNAVLKAVPNLPIGILMDFIILVLVLGIVYRCYHANEWATTFETPITWAILIWMAWHLIEFANPIAASRAAWFYVARPSLGYILLFFAVYSYLTNIARIQSLMLYILGLLSVAGIWGVIQFVNGYFPFEMNYIIQNEAVHLVFIQGRWRAFGPMGSPAHYGVVMAYTTIICWLLMGLRYPIWGKALLMLASFVCLMAMVYSGARSGYAVLPIGLMVVVGLSQNIKLYALSVLGGLVLAVIIVMPSDNYHIKRIQSTFHAEEDLSYNVREDNRKMITPWILAHPMGGGLGSTGVWGQRFSPGTFLANFPPDSGYLRVAVEMGWIGLLCYLLLWAAIMWKGVWGIFCLKDKTRRVLAIAIMASIAPLLVVESAQDIVGKLPSNLLFWIWVAMLLRLVSLPKELPSPQSFSPHQVKNR